MNMTAKRFLLTGTALVAASMLQVKSAHAIELDTPAHADIIAAVITGLQETTGTTAVLINSTPVGAGLALGANGTPSVTMNSAGNTLTLNVTASGTPYGVVFADNVTAAAGNIIINSTNDSLYFYGNVSENVLVNSGSSGADATTNVTINTFNAENITFAGAINAVDAGDTVQIGIYNNHGGANTVTFTGAIGGTTDDTRVDNINIGNDTAAPMDVKFQNSVNASGTITLGNAGAATNTNKVYFGASGATTSYTGTLQGAEAKDTNEIHIVGGSTTSFNSAFGNNLDSITIGANGTTTNTTFRGGIAAGALLTLEGVAGATNNITFDSTGASFTVAPTVQGVDAAGTHNIIISGANTVTMLGGATNIDSYTLGAGSTLRYESSGINNVGGAGNLTLASGNAQSAGNIGTAGAGNNIGTLRLEGAGAKNLTTAIYAATTEIDATTVNAAASINGNIHFTSTGTLNFAHNAGATNNGNVTTSANNQGTINFAGSSAVDGTVGANGAALNLIAINSGAGENVTLGGATHAATVRFTSAGTLNLGAGGNVIGTLDKQGANESVFNANTGSSTIGAVAVAAGGTLDLNGAGVSVTGASTLGNGATLRFEGASLGAVTGTGSNLTLDGAAQSVGAIGTAGNKLAALTLGGTGAKTLNGDVHATNTALGDHNVTMNARILDSNVNFSKDTAINFTSASSKIEGNVTNTQAGEGRLTYTGPFQIVGNVARLHTFNVTNTVDVTGNVIAADNMNVDVNTMNVSGTFATTANTQLTYRVNTPTTSGKIIAGGEVTVVAGTKVNMIVDTNVYVNQGQEFILIDGAESGAHVDTLAAGNLTTTSTALLHFKQKTDDKNNLVVYADRVQMNLAATIANNKALGAMLEQLRGSGDIDTYNLQVALGKLNTIAEVEAKLATLLPDVSGAATSSIVSVGSSTGNILNTRVASLRAGESYGSGMAAGNWAEGGHFWGQVFGSQADQGRRQGIAGYDADTYGTVIGVDNEFWDNIRTGIAFAYANTDVSGQDANRTQTDINSYQLSLYADYDLADRYYLTGQVSYMYSDIDSTRYNVAQIAGNNAHADYSSNQYSLRTEVGRAYNVEGTRFSLTPAGTFNYTFVDVEDYSERGAGGLSLRNVDNEDLHILEFGGKLKAEAKFSDSAGGTIAPNLHAGYSYDVIGDSVATSARLAGGGTAFKTEGFEPSKHTVSGGAGITWQAASDFELNLNYDYEHKSDYEAHSGYVRAGFKF